MTAQNIVSFKCLNCGSTELCFGYLGTTSNVFVPTGVFTVHGYRTRSYVCLKCGYMGNYLPKDKLEKLREKFSTQYD